MKIPRNSMVQMALLTVLAGLIGFATPSSAGETKAIATPGNPCW